MVVDGTWLLLAFTGPDRSAELHTLLIRIEEGAERQTLIEALKTRNYDVALLDLNMARLSGWEVLDFLRPRYAQRPAKLFIVTGFSDQVVSEADREMVSGILYKPVAPEELRMLVTECLNGATPDLRAILKTTQHRVV